MKTVKFYWTIYIFLMGFLLNRYFTAMNFYDSVYN